MIRIAIQSKGRLNEDSCALLKDAGITVDEVKRKFLGKAADFPLETLYLRDDDIPEVVADGSSDIGIVGLNEVGETGADVTIVRKLGFGRCRISLAIPKNEEYTGPQWFEGKSIATSYPKILGDYLAKNKVNATVRVIKGSVEIAPAAGIADAIFDIVSSGGTLVSNGLKEVERVFESEAVLIANKNITPEKQELLDNILFRFDSVSESRDMKYILMNLPSDKVGEALSILPAMRSPTVMPLAAEGWCSLHSVVKAEDLWDKIMQLKKIGAEGILVLNVDKVIA
ncbi:MAG: ATP phosphoribosyltransferase [Bacteroidales bacterium]|nr:ATP phosphoribosyltransferase [Bacteroidales bacterium]MBO7365320.1 ATP phosphoribosyltransferase [Bacteroidales bacterium]MBP5235252.1 ATP phosphoribosyltransferase [Bacteroidales bacterium]MEE3463324.1 ATP phosphoribosyltransferase [Candidatus Cryptobacteroides sp.]